VSVLPQDEEFLPENKNPHVLEPRKVFRINHEKKKSPGRLFEGIWEERTPSMRGKSTGG